MKYTIKHSNFLFDVTKGQANSTMTFIVTPEIAKCRSYAYGVHRNYGYSVDMDAIASLGYDGFLKLGPETCGVDVQLGGGMRVCVDVDKRYAWDKKEVICNQPVNYYCSKGWGGSIVAFVKEYIGLSRGRI
tara:strand:- start:194 stop:586 length:393 start_codon:yes stop_codon:yes gene_type:complete